MLFLDVPEHVSICLIPIVVSFVVLCGSANGATALNRIASCRTAFMYDKSSFILSVTLPAEPFKTYENHHT